MAAVQLASLSLLFCWAGLGTKTGQGPEALRLGEQQAEQQVEPLPTLGPTLQKIKTVLKSLDGILTDTNSL